MINREAIKIAIEPMVEEFMNSLIYRVTKIAPFDEKKHQQNKAIYAALVPDEIFKGSFFERRFVTAFGSLWEKLAITVSSVQLGQSIQTHRLSGNIKVERLNRITEVLNWLEHSEKGQERKRPDWDSEISYIMSGGGEDINITVICDVFGKDIQNGNRVAFEVKTPYPNSDITKVSKEKILKLYAMEPRLVDEAYFALPYNPDVIRAKYQWSPPKRWFNMRHDKVVLIGEEFWEKVGGEGTYEVLADIFNEIGKKYKDRIYREFLEIEPPENETNL